MAMGKLASLAHLGLAGITLAAFATGQCSQQFLPGKAAPYLSGSIGSTPRAQCLVSWDPDGTGPISPKMIVGGNFTKAGQLPASNVAALDLATWQWSGLGSGFASDVKLLATQPGQDLVAYGEVIGNFGRLSRWNGSSWTDFGGNPRLEALAMLPNGDVVGGGQFASTSGTFWGVGLWTGTDWQPLPDTVGWDVSALLASPSGDLIVGGSFANAGPLLVNGIAGWDGTSWYAYGNGLPGFQPGMTRPRALLQTSQGNLCTIGRTHGPIGQITESWIATWNGTSWTKSQTPFLAESLEEHAGQIVVGASTQYLNAFVFRFVNGNSWQALVGPPPGSDAPILVRPMIHLPNGLLVVGESVGPMWWNGAIWSTAWSDTLESGPLCMTEMPNGDVVAGGIFRVWRDVYLGYIARWDGIAWHPMGGGMNGRVRAVQRLPNGDIVAGGDFTMAGGVPANRIARWDGTSWHAMGSGMTGPSTPYVAALTLMPNGDLVAGGDFWLAGGAYVNHLARWDGSSWSGFGLMGWAVSAVLTTTQGDLIAGGVFQTAGGVPANRIARWNGATWSAMGSGIADGGVLALAELPGGDIVAAGWFTTAGTTPAANIARWDGSAWQPMGPGVNRWVYALAVRPNGELLAGGNFDQIGTGGVPLRQLARWDGTNWSEVGGGMRLASWMAIVTSLLQQQDGDVWCGGGFDGSATVDAHGLIVLEPTCRANAQTVPTACIGPAGPMLLTAESLPWLGGVYRSTTTGFASQCLGVAVLGNTATSQPLNQLDPTGLPNCELLATLDAYAILPVVAGAMDLELSLPSTPSLVGAVVHHQSGQIELDGTGAFLSLSSSNALVLTLGIP